MWPLSLLEFAAANGVVGIESAPFVTFQEAVCASMIVSNQALIMSNFGRSPNPTLLVGNGTWAIEGTPSGDYVLKGVPSGVVEQEFVCNSTFPAAETVTPRTDVPPQMLIKTPGQLSVTQALLRSMRFV